MGDTIPADVSELRLRVKLPDVVAVIRLIKNGDFIDSIVGDEATWNVKNKGVYRVEVYLDDKPWIYSNHIRFI